MQSGRAPRRKGIWRSIILALAFSALAFSLLLYFTETDISQAFRVVNLWYLLAAFLLILLNWALEAERLCSIVDAMGKDLTFPKALQIALVGSFIANITPFDTGGEPFQIYLLARNGIGAGKSAAVIMVKGIMSSLARLSLGIGIPLWLFLIKGIWGLPYALNLALNIGIAIYLFVTLLMILFTLKPQLFSNLVQFIFSRRFFIRIWKKERLDRVATKITHGIDDFHQSIRALGQTKKKNLFLIALYSLLLWLIVLTVPALLLWGMGVNSPLSQVLAVGIIFYLASAYAPTPGSSGVAEAGFAAIFFSANLIPYPLLGVFVILWRVLTYYMSFIVGGLVSLFSFFKKKR